MSQNIVLIISLLAIFNLSLIGIISWIKSKKNAYYFWLGCMFIATVFAIVDNTLILSGNGSIVIYHIGLSTNLAWGAYLISFVQCLRQPKNNCLKFNWKLYIPVYLYLPFFILTLFQPQWATETIKLAEKGQMTPFGIFYNFSICLYSIGTNAYLLWEEYFKKSKFDISKKQSSRIKEILWCMLILQLMAFIPFFLELNLHYILLYMPFFGQIFFIYIFLRMTLTNQNAFIAEYEITKTGDIVSKYSNIRITDQYAEEIIEKISKFMKSEKPYLGFDYNLMQLARDLKISQNMLSMVINSKLKTSFPDYINSLRVKNAIDLLQSKRKKEFTIEAIAYESGFNNRTSFYKAFKKVTGKLPSEFIKSTIEIAKVV